MRVLFLSAALGLATFIGLTPTQVSAQEYWDGRDHHRHDGHYGRYYGRGGHDFYPHWHRTATPFGTFRWYGQGFHDYAPHRHRYSPYAYRGRFYYPWGGFTESYYPPYPYYNYSW